MSSKYLLTFFFICTPENIYMYSFQIESIRFLYISRSILNTELGFTDILVIHCTVRVYLCMYSKKSKSS